MTVTDEIKSRIDIVDIVSETVKLRRSGKSLSGFCPFHPNSRTPAFVVFPDSGTWRCFGQCNEGGDIFKYIMKREGMDFSQALKYLAERAGVQLTPPSPEQDQSRLVNDRLENTLEQAVVFFRNQLIQTSAGKVALDYLYQAWIERSNTRRIWLWICPGFMGSDDELFYKSWRGYRYTVRLRVGLGTGKWRIL